MIDSFFIAATGMHAQQKQIDSVSNNLANLNTHSYKKSHVAFESLMATQLEKSFHAPYVREVTVKGVGVSAVKQNTDFSAGEMIQTGRALDVAINGEGFFEVQLPDGSYAYTRNGHFEVNSEGVLVTSGGAMVSPGTEIPFDATDVVIGGDGAVQVKYANAQEFVQVGSLEIARFENESTLVPIGSSMYLKTEQSGDPVFSRPDEFGAGKVRQGYLESSNVEMVEEITTMMVAQRAYQANSRVLQMSDQVLEIINNLKS
ncbi:MULTISPECIES: flagellar basal-body rod protein FlgG [Microbulbifer]|uniref:flagellar basal-body rod protein FlgG n=1 Tax=Microbulbifer TaxID=48073 RepID=UPI001E5D5286|nr:MULTISPECIES: flagellar basal-body rod protein FlgG [Microbulbifer]UHQ56903.1 flagellar basal-body rod protein FlgG [Microbulbifer sp. YPW16]